MYTFVAAETKKRTVEIIGALATEDSNRHLLRLVFAPR